MVPILKTFASEAFEFQFEMDNATVFNFWRVLLALGAHDLRAQLGSNNPTGVSESLMGTSPLAARSILIQATLLVLLPILLWPAR